MSVGTVLTLGYGSFGKVSFIPVLGFGQYDDSPVTRETGGGCPRVQWGEWTTPWTSPVPGPDVRAIVGKILGEEVGIAEQLRDAAIDREIEARAEVERAKTLKAKRRASKALRAERALRERTMGAAYNAAFEAAFERYVIERRMQDDDEDAVAMILMMH